MPHIFHALSVYDQVQDVVLFQLSLKTVATPLSVSLIFRDEIRLSQFGNLELSVHTHVQQNFTLGLGELQRRTRASNEVKP